MKILEFSYAMNIKFSEPALRHCFSLRCLPFDNSYQNLREMFIDISPHNCLTETSDGFGNRILTDRITEAHSEFSVFVTGTAEINLDLREPEPLSGIYKYPSKFTHIGEQLSAFQAELKPLLENKSVLEASEILMRKMEKHFSYVSGATNIHTTAEEAFQLGKGVCQDFSHIFLALARENGIPARYVVGIPEGVGETHAWVEVYEQGLWYGVDPTNHKFVDERYLKLSHGRDFSDCSVNRGVLIGGGIQTQSIEARVKVLDATEV